jgi:hypothetical protein
MDLGRWTLDFGRKRQNIGGPVDSAELSIELPHARVADERHGHLTAQPGGRQMFEPLGKRAPHATAAALVGHRDAQRAPAFLVGR